MKISHLDHLVLTVADIPTATNFYEKVLGMKAVSFGAGRIALEFGHQKINLHQLGNEFEPKAQNVRVGSADLCFITDTVLSDAMKHVENQGVTIMEGPVKRTGAQGAITSFYFRDPDGNLIEVSTYSNT
ncbi:VOC family protein [Vibrio cholerae]|uniref:VOC family protein n=1 Tax=Vibrio cholerae TaxID=666 RepID=UPI0028B4125C|nr:VOC family protein [Vibrio cholerae]EKF9975176.1 VOC family protein [Vibrio cholerae]ELK0391653.1 VOC family protein [Vibrio cholerae]HDL9487806.1 VOC family protein [Vibrio cholerae]HDZ3695973.1 VOC family protein [Vibrio cholerae]